MLQWVDIGPNISPKFITTSRSRKRLGYVHDILISVGAPIHQLEETLPYVAPTKLEVVKTITYHYNSSLILFPSITSAQVSHISSSTLPPDSSPPAMQRQPNPNRPPAPTSNQKVPVRSPARTASPSAPPSRGSPPAPSTTTTTSRPPAGSSSQGQVDPRGRTSAPASRPSSAQGGQQQQQQQQQRASSTQRPSSALSNRSGRARGADDFEVGQPPRMLQGERPSSRTGSLFDIVNAALQKQQAGKA